MSEATIFLLVLVLVLVAANWVISKIRPSSSNLQVKFFPQAVALQPSEPEIIADSKIPQNASNELNQLLASLSATNSVLKQKVNLLAMKLGEIEQKMFASPESKVMSQPVQAIPNSQTIQNVSSRKQEEILRLILKKLDELDRFKSNTQVDLQGMKEIIQEKLNEQKKEDPASN